jgi:chloramphenicol-sensitive protein RarD
MERINIKGYIMTFSAYVLWGIIPLYWKQLTSIGSLELISLRIIVTVITLLSVVLAMRNPLFIGYLKDGKKRKQLMVSSGFIAINWGVFVYAINSGHLVQASLGYYMNPLISMLLGIVILKERLSKAQYISIILAFAGVLFLTFGYNEFPWISLILAFSFAFYGFFKKTYHLDSLHSLLVEGLYLLPIVIGITFMTNATTKWVADVTVNEWGLLMLAGLITSIPLILFSNGAKLIPLSAVGFLQYIAPTLMLLIGVLLYGEVFTTTHKISFALIWLGLLIYTVSLFTQSFKKRAVVET